MSTDKFSVVKQQGLFVLLYENKPVGIYSTIASLEQAKTEYESLNKQTFQEFLVNLNKRDDV